MYKKKCDFSMTYRERGIKCDFSMTYRERGIWEEEIYGDAQHKAQCFSMIFFKLGGATSPLPLAPHFVRIWRKESNFYMCLTKTGFLSRVHDLAICNIQKHKQFYCLLSLCNHL